MYDDTFFLLVFLDCRCVLSTSLWLCALLLSFLTDETILKRIKKKKFQEFHIDFCRWLSFAVCCCYPYIHIFYKSYKRIRQKVYVFEGKWWAFGMEEREKVQRDGEKWETNTAS